MGEEARVGEVVAVVAAALVVEEVIALSVSKVITPCRHLRPSSGREHTVI